MKKPVISSEALYALSDTTTPEKETIREPQALPKVKVSFWTRICGFFKKVASVVRHVLDALSVCASVLNAASRFKRIYHTPIGASA